MVILTYEVMKKREKKKETRDYKLILDQTFSFFVRSYARLK